MKKKKKKTIHQVKLHNAGFGETTHNMAYKKKKKKKKQPQTTHAKKKFTYYLCMQLD